MCIREITVRRNERREKRKLESGLGKERIERSPFSKMAQVFYQQVKRVGTFEKILPGVTTGSENSSPPFLPLLSYSRIGGVGDCGEGPQGRIDLKQNSLKGVHPWSLAVVVSYKSICVPANEGWK